jgi:plastocyanin
MRHSILLLPLALALAGCGPGLTGPVKELTAEIGPDHVQRVTIRTHSYWFDPNRIVVKRGIPVELTVHNASYFVPHSFECDAQEAGIDVDAHAGMFHGKGTVRFTPTTAGEYHFHCGVDHHMRKGMTGVLVVTE